MTVDNINRSPDKADQPDSAPVDESGGRFVALSLRANFSWMLVGNVIYSACQWGMLIALAKLSTTEAVGQFALGIAITAPVIMFTNLQLREVQITDARQDYAYGDYVALRIVSTIICMVTILIVVLISDYPHETKLVIALIGLAKSFEALSDLFYGLIQQHEQMNRIARGLIIKGVSSLAAMATILAITNQVTWATGSMAVVWALTLLIYDLPNAARVVGQVTHSQPTAGYWPTFLRPRWRARTMVKLMRMALPLGLMMLLVSLNTNIPRYFLESYRSTEELGVFAALAYLVVAERTITLALGSALMPRLAVYYANQKERAFQKLLLKGMGFGAVLGIGGILVALIGGETLLRLLYKPEYAEHVDVFVLVMVATGIRSVESFINNGITAARFFAVHFPLAASVTASTVALSLWLIPERGLQGAAEVLVISTIVKLIGSALALMYALRKLHLTRITVQGAPAPTTLSADSAT